MKTGILLNDLLYVEEHLSCRNYMSTIENGFKYLEFDEETNAEEECLERNFLQFFLKGTFIISCNQFCNREFHAGEIILLPQSSMAKITAEKGSQLLSLSFDLPQNSCDKFVLQSLTGICNKIDYDFCPIEIRFPVTSFLETLVYCLKNGMSCLHLHDIMQKEFFLLMRGFYKVEEIANLFYPVIGKELDFKSFVMQNYRKVKTIDELIALSNLGRSRFFAKFKEVFKMTVKQWMVKQTNERILGKVTEPGICAKQLVEFCGFESQSHLNRYIRQHFNCTPKQLIERYLVDF